MQKLREAPRAVHVGLAVAYAAALKFTWDNSTTANNLSPSGDTLAQDLGLVQPDAGAIPNGIRWETKREQASLLLRNTIQGVKHSHLSSYDETLERAREIADDLWPAKASRALTDEDIERISHRALSEVERERSRPGRGRQ